MSDVKRIDPRRPFRITPDGLRRITLGDTGAGFASGSDAPALAKSGAKPQRIQKKVEAWHMVIAHAIRGALDDHARQAIAAAAILASDTTGVIAVMLGDVQEDLASYGVDLSIALPDLDPARYHPERELAVISALIDTYKPVHVFLPDNAYGDGDLGRRLIAKFGVDGATHVVEIDAEHVAVTWSGTATRAHANLPRFILLEHGVADTELPYVGAGDTVPPSQVADFSSEICVCRDRGLEQTDASQMALEEADFIVSAGNGVQNVMTVETLARTLGAAVGASRVAVDDGKFPREKQIGATGKTVSASAYIAVGISGAVQHLQGIKDCRHVIAINRDAGAPIVKRADLTVIGDAEELMQALIRRVSQARDQREMPEGK